MDYELAFWIGMAIAMLIFVRVVYILYGPSKTVSEETLRRL